MPIQQKDSKDGDQDFDGSTAMVNNQQEVVQSETEETSGSGKCHLQLFTVLKMVVFFQWAAKQQYIQAKNLNRKKSRTILPVPNEEADYRR